MKVYNKLVRDKIPQIIQNEGKVVYYSMLDGDNLRKMLTIMLIEESRDVSEAITKEEMINELADVSEVIEAIYEAFDITDADVDLIKHKKIQEKGTYKSGAYLMCAEE